VGRRTSGPGFTLPEALVALAIVGLAAGVGAPVYLEWAGRAPLAAAARELTAEYGAMRFRAVAQNRAQGLWFRRLQEGWGFQRVRDGNGNGLRVAELRSGVDEILDAVRFPQDRRGRATYGFVEGGPFPGVPPRAEPLVPSDDPIRFGRSDIVSFKGNGHASSGTVYLTDGRERMWAVVLYGRSGRVRAFRYDRREGRWKR